MIIAQQKRKENIAEYILYMWQIEDIIRANQFDINKLDQYIISNYNQPKPVIEEIRNWYANLIIMMQEEKITKTGHLSLVKEVISDLNELHFELLEDSRDKKYEAIFKTASSNISEFRKKGDFTYISDIEVCLVALYGILLLKLKQKEIHPETLKAITSISNVLAYLSMKFREKEGK